MKNLLFVVMAWSALCAQTFLSGEMADVITAGEYVVTGTIYVPRGQTLRIQPGARLYFELYTGITVLGTLICEGSLDIPVFLTSVRERETDFISGRPEPFDWNGIEVTPDAQYVELRNTRIRHSVFGLNIKSVSSRIRLERVEFYNNGYTSISREGNIVQVQQDIPINITWNIGDNVQKNERMVINQKDIPQEKPAPNPETETRRRSPARVFFRVAGAGLFVAGGILFAVESAVYSHNSEDYKEPAASPGELKEYRENMDRAQAIRWPSLGCALLGALGCTLTFVF